MTETFCHQCYESNPFLIKRSFCLTNKYEALSVLIKAHWALLDGILCWGGKDGRNILMGVLIILLEEEEEQMLNEKREKCGQVTLIALCVFALQA